MSQGGVLALVRNLIPSERVAALGKSIDVQECQRPRGLRPIAPSRHCSPVGNKRLLGGEIPEAPFITGTEMPDQTHSMWPLRSIDQTPKPGQNLVISTGLVPASRRVTRTAANRHHITRRTIWCPATRHLPVPPGTTARRRFRRTCPTTARRRSRFADGPADEMRLWSSQPRSTRQNAPRPIAAADSPKDQARGKLAVPDAMARRSLETSDTAENEKLLTADGRGDGPQHQSRGERKGQRTELSA